MSAVDPWAYWTAEQIASTTSCPVEAVRDTWPRVVAQLERCGIADRSTQIAAIGTIAIESASRFAPVREAFWLSEEWRRSHLRYYPWYGRGVIQVTWRENYEAYSRKVNDLWGSNSVDLIARPDDALDPDISAAVLALYFRDHGGDGIGLIPQAARRGDMAEVRRLVQGGTDGLDRLVAMASALDAYAVPAPISKEPVLAANDALRVADGPARLRSAPSTAATIVRELPTGTALIDLGDALVDADGHRWRRVALGSVGYVADELLASVGEDQPQAPGRYTFNPDFPTQIQRQDWTCSIRSTMMLLDSIGISVTPAEAQDAMSPRYVNADVGLLDASGAGIGAVLREHWGVEAVNFGSLSFDEAMSLAGTGPLAIGLRNWGGPHAGHGSAVRGKEGDRLVLANPAGTGPRYGQQTLDRQEYDARGPASGVFIPIAG